MLREEEDLISQWHLQQAEVEIHIYERILFIMISSFFILPLTGSKPVAISYVYQDFSSPYSSLQCHMILQKS